MANEFKSYSNRDGAVSVLRKMGIPKTSYNKYVAHDKTAGVFIVDVKAAQEAMGLPPAAEAAAPVPAEKKTGKPAGPAKPKKAVKKTAAPKEKKASLAAQIRAAIAKYGTDEAGRIKIKEELKEILGPDRLWFVAWYIGDMKRKGQLG